MLLASVCALFTGYLAFDLMPRANHAITRTLFSQGLDIHRSKIATEANRAVDVFYVRDKASGEKVTQQERRDALRGALLASLPQQ